MVAEDDGAVLAPLEDSLEEGDVRVEGGSEEDALELQHATNVAPSSAEQVETHRVSHYPYRSRCKQCVMGRGVGKPHTKSTQESVIPIVGMGYFYIAKEGVRRREELATEMEHRAGEAPSPVEGANPGRGRHQSSQDRGRSPGVLVSQMPTEQARVRACGPSGRR